MALYDNTAFYYFALSMCTLYLIPGTWIAFRRIIDFIIGSRKHLTARTKVERSKIKEIEQENKAMHNVFTVGFIVHLILLALTWLLFVKMITLVVDVPEIESFDPYSVLGIALGTPEQAIKRAYRKLSLKYHPDRNPNDPVAEQKFMLIAKAYEALTDDAARENFEKYGNPDGRQPLQVSLGLPVFFEDKSNHNLILLIYLMGLCIVVPSVVALWYSKSKQYGDNDILYDTYGFFNFTLSENSHLKLLPEILAGAAEFRKLPAAPETQEELMKLMKQMKGEMMYKPKFNHPAVLRTNIILHAYLNRIPLSKALQKDLKVILKDSVRLVDAMLDIATMRNWMQTCSAVLDLSQFLVQGLWIKDSSLLQIPHFTDYEVKHAMSGKGGVKNLQQFIKLEHEKRKGMVNFSEDQLQDVENALKVFPDITVECSVGVEDEPNIAVGDLLTLTVKITRNNLKEGEQALPVYSDRYPLDRRERWFIFVRDAGANLMTFHKVTNQDRVVIEKINIPSPPQPGEWGVDVLVKSDCYVGLDVRQLVKFTVMAADSLPKIEIHPEDAALDDEPGLFDTVGGTFEEDTDSEVEFDDEDEKPIMRLKKAPKASSETAGGSEEDSDAEGEPSTAGSELKGKI